jgi:hypothetical protein
MKGTDKIILGAFGLSWLLSLILSFIIWAIMVRSINGDFEKIMIANLQLNGILFGFVATILAFLLKKLVAHNVEMKMSLAYATTAFASFFFSVSFSFFVLLNVEQALPIYKLLPIGFTLTGIITTIAFLVDITLRAIRLEEEKQKQKEKE